MHRSFPLAVLTLVLITIACSSSGIFPTAAPTPTPVPTPIPIPLPVSTGSEWKLAYAHDKDGTPTAGDIEVLIDAIKNGQAVRMVFENQDGYYSMEAEALWVKNGVVYAQNNSQVSVAFQGKALRFQDDSYYWMIVVSTLGDLDQIRWSVGQHVSRGHTNDKTAVKWFVR